MDISYRLIIATLLVTCNCLYWRAKKKLKHKSETYTMNSCLMKIVGALSILQVIALCCNLAYVIFLETTQFLYVDAWLYLPILGVQQFSELFMEVTLIYTWNDFIETYKKALGLMKKPCDQIEPKKVLKYNCD